MHNKSISYAYKDARLTATFRFATLRYGLLKRYTWRLKTHLLMRKPRAEATQQVLDFNHPKKLK